MSGCTDCGKQARPDSRVKGAREQLEAHPGALGPGLGGGVVPQSLTGGSSLPKVGGGGGLDAITDVPNPFEIARPYTEQRFAFDYSTPLARQDTDPEPPLGRAFGGLR